MTMMFFSRLDFDVFLLLSLSSLLLLFFIVLLLLLLWEMPRGEEKWLEMTTVATISMDLFSCGRGREIVGQRQPFFTIAFPTCYCGTLEEEGK